MNKRLMNRQCNTALVTGASSGIGLEICRKLAKHGYPLLMISNEEIKLAEEGKKLKSQYGVNTTTLFMDLAKKDAAQNIFDFCRENNIHVEIIVNNAGIFFFKDIIDTNIERIETVLNLHICTPVMLCRLFAEQMIHENRKGYILNMASIASRMMMPGITLYSSTKSFLRCFSRAMRNETFYKKVSITTISPGAVGTGLYNLSSRYMKLGIKLGIILPPERLASLAVKKMFKRKAEYIPGGLINRLFILIVMLIPEALIRRIKKKFSLP